MIHFCWLFLAVAASLSPIASAQKSPLSAICAECKDEKGRPRAAIGPFEYVRANLVTYRLPKTEAIRGFGREEPWVFSLTLRSREGPPCDVKLARGPDDPVAKAFSQSIKGWVFRPFHAGKMGPACFVTKLFVYVREQNGRSTIIIPGVTDLHNER